jgi:misacylated tRNA(Ala) deacylase
MPAPTERLYLADDHPLQVSAAVVAVREGALALERSCFYPGGGGQPPDAGILRLPGGEAVPLASAQLDADGVLWHAATSALPDTLLGCTVLLEVDPRRRAALARYHTVLHVLNTVALRDHGGWITGAQIAVDYARIDFKLDGLPPEVRSDLEHKVNGVIADGRPLRSYYLDETQFNRSHDLLRTLEVRPPVHDGRVRVVAIEGFDAQACGGTHVRNTLELGSFRIERTENKGRINKRLYVRLEARGPTR